MAPTPSEANHVFVALKTFFNFAFRRGYIETSPIARLQKPHKDRPRRRVLTLESSALCSLRRRILAPMGGCCAS